MSSDYGQSPYRDGYGDNAPSFRDPSPHGWQPPYSDQSRYGDQPPYSGPSGDAAPWPYGNQSGHAGQPYPGGPYGDPWAYGPGYGAPAYSYGAPGYGYGAPGGLPLREHPRGTTVLVLGILSLVINFAIGLGFILGIIALVTGKRTLSEIDANPGLYTNRGTVLGGLICGLISCIWSALGILTIVVIIIIGVAAAAAAS